MFDRHNLFKELCYKHNKNRYAYRLCVDKEIYQQRRPFFSFPSSKAKFTFDYCLDYSYNGDLKQLRAKGLEITSIFADAIENEEEEATMLLEEHDWKQEQYRKLFLLVNKKRGKASWMFVKVDPQPWLARKRWIGMLMFSAFGIAFSPMVGLFGVLFCFASTRFRCSEEMRLQADFTLAEHALKANLLTLQ